MARRLHAARQLVTDGPLAAEYFTPRPVQSLDAQVWGQAFEPPVFSDEVEIVSQRLVGEKHCSSCATSGSGARGDLVRPRRAAAGRVTLAYRLDADEWRGVRRVRFLVEGAEF